MAAKKALALTVLMLAAASCGDGDDVGKDAGKVDLGTMDAAVELPPVEDAETPPEQDAEVEQDAGPSDAGPSDAGPLDAGPPDAGNLSDPAVIERGRYLTTNVFPCGGCHTSRSEPTKLFGGVDCWTDSLPNDPMMGCLSSRNLTNHETGLKNLSTAEVKDLILKGLRPDGKYLHPQMPTNLLGNMRDDDAFAIVAYLRSLPPVDHMVSPNQAPFNVQPATPVERWPDALIPMPRSDYADRDAALRGRYLAGNLGGCMDCHTPRAADNTQIKTKAFQGGRRFTSSSIPDPYFSSNLTPHATGIAGWTVEDIVRAIKRGEDKSQSFSRLCPPMPSGPMGAYGGMREADARDIAHYLLSLPPVDNMIAGDCQLPPPDAGTPDGGADAGPSDAGADAAG